MLVVSVAATTFGPSPFDYDLASVCIVTANHDGMPLRSLQVDVKPAYSPVYGSLYRVHPDYVKDSLPLFDGAADLHSVADVKLVLFIISDLIRLSYIKSVSEESLANVTDLSSIMSTLQTVGRDSVLTVTRRAHIVLPFIQRFLPATYMLLSHNVIDIQSDVLLRGTSAPDHQPALFSTASAYIAYYNQNRNQQSEVCRAA